MREMVSALKTTMEYEDTQPMSFGDDHINLTIQLITTYPESEFMCVIQMLDKKLPNEILITIDSPEAMTILLDGYCSRVVSKDYSMLLVCVDWSILSHRQIAFDFEHT